VDSPKVEHVTKLCYNLLKLEKSFRSVKKIRGNQSQVMTYLFTWKKLQEWKY